MIIIAHILKLSNMNTTSIVLVAVLGVLAIFLFTTYNTFIKLRNKVNEAFALMDIHLKKRYDLIPMLLSVVKGYMQHEAETLANATKARTQAVGMAEQLGSEAVISDAIQKIIVNVEGYPQLKSDTHFTELQKQLIAIENELVSARRYFNGSVRQFNTKCQTFPNNIIANMFNFKTMSMFEANSIERNNISIDHEQ